MQGYADAFGIEWRDEEKRNTAERKEAVKAINRMLDDRLVKAETAQKAAPGADAAGVARP